MITNPTAVIGNNSNGYHPYYDVQGGVTFRTGGVTFHIAIAGGYNAMGLIGTECNGILLADHTNRQMIFDEYLRRGMGHDYLAERQREVERIVNMDAETLNSFLRNTPGLRLRFNPFEGRRLAVHEKKVSKKIDAGLAKKIQCADAQFTDAKTKAKMARDWELFLIKRLATSAGPLPPTEEMEMQKAFTKALYSHFSLHLGFIAHFNRLGFYEAQFAELPQFLRNVKMVAGNESTYGNSLTGDRDYADLNASMVRVAQHYLPLLRKLHASAEEASEGRDIEQAKALLARKGMKVSA